MIHVEEHLGLANMVAHKYCNTGIEYEELQGTAYLGLVKASQSYDDTRGVKFTTYASHVIHNEILMYLRKARRQRGVQSYDTQIADQDGAKLRVLDMLPDYENGYELVEDHITAAQILSTMDPQERKIIMQYYIYGKRQGILAKQYGCSQPVLSRRIRKIRAKIQQRARVEG